MHLVKIMHIRHEIIIVWKITFSFSPYHLSISFIFLISDQICRKMFNAYQSICYSKFGICMSIWFKLKWILSECPLNIWDVTIFHCCECAISIQIVLFQVQYENSENKMTTTTTKNRIVVGDNAAFNTSMNWICLALRVE